MSNTLYLPDSSRATELVSLMLMIVMVALMAGFIQRDEFDFKATSKPNQVAKIDPKQDPKGHSKQLRLEQITQRFEQAVAMLHAKQYDYAITALHRVLELSPRMPEAHVNMGYALLGLERNKAAGDFFNTAIELSPYLGNAYWGLAIVLEKGGDYQGALGAMRTYIHLAKANDPYVRKARSALWEWENRLTRGPLPKEEEEWLKKRGQEWMDRNSPQADAPDKQTGVVDLFEGAKVP